MKPAYNYNESISAEENIPRFVPDLYVSEEEYWNTYYSYPDVSYEWNNGILEEKPMGDYLSSQLYRWFMRLLDEYINTYPIAEIITMDMGFRLALPHKVTIRKPDLAIIHASNPVRINPNDRSFHGIYDLCIEFLSDSSKKEVERDTVQKKSEYCGIGVKEYFILDRKGNETAFYRLSEKRRYSPIIPVDGDIIQSAVLEGFQFRISHLYSRPPLIDLVKDPVYTHYVMKEYQEANRRTEVERKIAEAERKRADEERKIAEAERKRADRLAEKLRSLGIDPSVTITD